MEKELVLIINFGGKYSQLIAGKVRNLNVYCEVIPYTTHINKIKEMNPKGIIFTGIQSSVNEQRAAYIEKEIYNLDIPTMEICYRTQSLPDDMDKIIENFLFKEAGCSGDWKMADFVKDSVENLQKTIGNKKVLCALSGGVDSSVAAVMIGKAVGKQLTCIFVDHGLMRKNEGNQVEEVFTNNYDLNFIRVNAQQRFYDKLKGVSDPETKRKIIGEEFIRVFEEEAKKIGTVDYLVQGTIYPDIIESGVGDGAVIKSHHNVGGLPDYVDFKEIIEPLRDLFKEEVRRAGLELGLPKELVMRQPFPGPGLAIRIIGDITEEKVKILQEADYIFRNELINAGLDKDLNQYFAVLTNLKSVGVTEAERTYDFTLALRAVTTIDFMTAEFAHIPWNILGEISEKIINEVDSINRIVYDITNKPPATIEWE